MKTEQEWIELYHKFWEIFGNNNVRLTLGQFEEVNRWGKIQIVGIWDLRYSLTRLKQIVELCEKFKLKPNWDNSYGELNLYEDYEGEIENG